MPSTDDKRQERLVLRLNQELHDALSRQADTHNRSVNGEICMAVQKWLYERDSLVLVNDRLLATASADTVASIKRRTPIFDLATDGDQDICKVPVRMKEEISFDMREAHATFKKGAEGFVSLNAFMKMMVAWWICYNFQAEECAKAIYQDFKASSTTQSRVSFARFPCKNQPVHRAALSA